MNDLLSERFPELRTRQRQVIAAVAELTKEYGYPPTIQQLCDVCGLRSTSSMHYHLTLLKNQGFIVWDSKKKRSVCLSPEVQAVLLEHSNASETHDDSASVTTSNGTMSRLPLLGTIAAGSPLQTTSDTMEWLDLDTNYLPEGCYALKVKGLSMIEDHIMDGDIVIINPKAAIRDGDVVVALVEQEEATLKRLYREEGRVRLQPANAEMEPIYTTAVDVQGKVETIIRKVF